MSASVTPTPSFSPKMSAAVFLTVLAVPLLLAYAAAAYGAVASVYTWFLLVHLAGLLGFMLSHGAPAFVAMRLPASSPETSMAYLNLARDRYVALSMGITLGLVLSTGISLGFFGGFWTRGWVWATLGGAVVITFAMTFLGRRQFDEALKALRNGQPVRRGTPGAAAAVGFLGLVLILWMVLFKPF